MPRSSYNYRRHRANRINPDLERLKIAAIQIHKDSRGAAGARTISGMLTQRGESVGRYKAASLMRSAGLVSKQLKKHRYKLPGDESVIAPNILNRQFTVERSNQVWCGDVTYVWSGLHKAVVDDNGIYVLKEPATRYGAHLGYEMDVLSADNTIFLE